MQNTSDLKSIVDEINSDKSIDFVLVGGDVSNFGDSVSLLMAKKAFLGLKVPFYVVPGNHDFQWNSTQQVALFKRIFGDDKFCFTFHEFCFIGFATAPILRGTPAYIQPDDINWISSKLAGIDSTKKIIAVTHYPLFASDVSNQHTIIALLKKYNILACLNGHYHQNTIFNIDGIPSIVNRTMMKMITDKSPSYSIYTIDKKLTVCQKNLGSTPELWFELPLSADGGETN